MTRLVRPDLKRVSVPGVCAQPPQPIVGGRHPHGLGHERGKYLPVFGAVERRRSGLHKPSGPMSSTNASGSAAAGYRTYTGP